MYKHKSNAKADATPHKSKFVSLNKLPNIIMLSRGANDGESKSNASIPIVPQSDPETSTPTFVICQSFTIIRPLQWFSPTLNYILLNDGGKLQSYKETLQDENSNKWESAMKDEADHLLGKQTWELT